MRLTLTTTKTCWYILSLHYTCETIIANEFHPAGAESFLIIPTVSLLLLLL